MSGNAHLRLVGGTATRINIPTVVEFNMKDLVEALSGITSRESFIKAFLSGGNISFQATSNGVGDYTFRNPFGSNPQKAKARDRDIYATMRRYQGPIIAMCRQLVEKWNNETNKLIERGFKATHLRFNEEVRI